MMSGRRAIAVAAVTAVAAGVAYALWRRRQPHLVADPESRVSFKRPVLIINPHSGDGKAQRIDLAGAAAKLGIETVVRQQGEKISKLAESAVDGGCDHLIIAGGDGSLARVAKVAIERDVAFSCVPSGTRNHFAMDLGLDRSDPAKALDAAFDGVEFKIDVGRIGKRVFLNNVSFGIYADALSDPDYRSHRTESVIDATKETLEDPDTRLSVQGPDGTTYDDIEILLASNNPYRFIGRPDFAGRASLDTGTLGVILVDRTSTRHTDLEHSDIERWTAPTMTVASTKKKVPVGIDGSLHTLKAPVDIGVENKALRVVLATELVKREIQESSAPGREALAHLSGAFGIGGDE
jgi:diacylglycerol kinase family enzyme